VGYPFVLPQIISQRFLTHISQSAHNSGWAPPFAICSGIETCFGKNIQRSLPLARSHYQFKKRQKELAKKQKKEEKRQRKLEKNTQDTDVDPKQPTEQADSSSV
jgi:hypothetical protein